MDKYVLEKVTMVGILTWLNENRSKKSGIDFSYSDVQGYIRRGCLPEYLGGHIIEREKDENLKHLKIYNIVT